MLPITIRCRRCGKDIPISATIEQIRVWQDGILIQNAMPNVPPAEREMLISKTCDTCFKELFPPKEL